MLDPNQALVRLEVGDGEAKRLPDPHAAREQQLEQTVRLLTVRALNERVHLLDGDEWVRSKLAGRPRHDKVGLGELLRALAKTS